MNTRVGKQYLFGPATEIKFRSMSTVAEIESAIEKLPADEVHSLIDWLLAKSKNDTTKPKTGAELARLWSARFHLSPAEAEALATDLDVARTNQPAVRPSAWE